MTVSAGRFSRELRELARSGADTGGGIAVVSVIWIGVLDVSRLTPPGAGGITLPDSADVERVRSRVTLGAGATTDGLSVGEFEFRALDVLGAGGIMTGVRTGAIKVRSRESSLETVGAGGIRFVLSVGPVRERSRDIEGDGAITESS